jgi:hypothetical protein
MSVDPQEITKARESGRFPSRVMFPLPGKYSAPAYTYENETPCKARVYEPHVDEDATKGVDPALCAEIERAEAILEHMEEAKEEDAPVYSRDTLIRASVFLKAHSAQLRKMYRVFGPVPNIGPGPNGSVDLHWRLKDRELLVNIPADSGETAAYYGDNYGTEEVKNSFDPATFDWGIIAWLMRG